MEYQWLPKRLKLNGAICIEPLSSEEVNEYLTAGGSKLEALREAIDADPVLQELAQTPLMLSIMSLASQGAGGNELAKQNGNSPEARRKQIFHLYVEQMFQRKGTTSPVFPKEKIISWLSWLAGKMREHSQSVFLPEGLQPSWLGTRAKRVAYGTIVALTLGLIFGPSLGLNYVLGRGLMMEQSDVLIATPIFGLIVGLIILVGVGLGCWSESPSKNGFVSGLIGTLSFGLIVGPIYGLSLGLSLGLGIGLIAGLVFGLIVGLNRGGSAVIKHYALRLILWRKGYTPFNFVKFLDQCARLILLKKVGGGYIFIHRMLLEYFAEITPRSTRAEAGKAGLVGP